MKHLICVSLVLSMGWLLGACQSAPPPPGDPMQVTWGATVYRLQCARCHAPGHVAPLLTAERLIRYGNAHDLYAYIQQSMPLDIPSALPEQDYWDVTAYVLANADMLLVPTLKPLGPDIAESPSSRKGSQLASRPSVHLANALLYGLSILVKLDHIVTPWPKGHRAPSTK